MKCASSFWIHFSPGDRPQILDGYWHFVFLFFFFFLAGNWKRNWEIEHTIIKSNCDWADWKCHRTTSDHRSHSNIDKLIFLSGCKIITGSKLTARRTDLFVRFFVVVVVCLDSALVFMSSLWSIAFRTFNHGNHNQIYTTFRHATKIHSVVINTKVNVSHTESDHQFRMK